MEMIYPTIGIITGDSHLKHMPPSPTKKGQTFYFTADDDLWVYINNQLVIDLGGLHPPLEKNVNLNDLGLTVGQDYHILRRTSYTRF